MAYFSWAARAWRKIEARVGVGLVVLAVIYAVFSGGYQIHQRNVTGCQVRFNNTYARVTKLRAKLGDTDRRVTVTFSVATGDLIHAVFHPPPGASQADRARLAFAAEAKWEAARKLYRATEATITAERRAHPFPKLPSAACR